MHPDNLRFLLGLKVKTLRTRRGLTLADLGARTGLAVSYLSEIEKGRKYPKPDKILALAGALGASFDELVSTRLGPDLVPLTELLDSVLTREFPLELFGLSVENLFGIVTDHPRRAAALVRTIFDLGRMYDVEHEDFLLAALRSWQQLHRNHFPDCEEAALRLRDELGWSDRREPLHPEELEDLLRRRWGYELDHRELAADPEVSSFRSLFVEGTPPRFYVNPRLQGGQQAFVLAREVGYNVLSLGERATTSSWIAAESFEQVLNNFLASYFASALLLPRERVLGEVREWLARPVCDVGRLVVLLESWDATPETAFHRFTEVMPEGLGLKELAFLRFSRPAGATEVRATKMLNLSSLPLERGFAVREHRCRRAGAFGLFDQLEAHSADRRAVAAGVRRVSILGSRFDWIEVSLVRSLSLADGLSAVTLLIGLDEGARASIGFADDPALEQAELGLTCERCPLAPGTCAERVAPAIALEAQQRRTAKSAAVARFVAARSAERDRQSDDGAMRR
jgi:transcriptional regulator with XRE-family HTH domain